MQGAPEVSNETPPEPVPGGSKGRGPREPFVECFLEFLFEGLSPNNA